MPLILLAASGLIIYAFDRIVGDLLPASMDRLRIKSVLLLIGCLHLYLLAQIACIVWLEVPVCEHDGYEVRGKAGGLLWARRINVIRVSPSCFVVCTNIANLTFRKLSVPVLLKPAVRMGWSYFTGE